MHRPHPVRPADSAELERKLRADVRGDVRFDRLSRTIYSTDASIYEIVPQGVILPRDAEDVAASVRICVDFGASIIPRGAGTGLAGGAVGPGVQLDCSRYMNWTGPVDLATRTIEVGPGVVLDELNAFVRPHGLHFAPDVATSGRATIGGMIANNSCGAHSVIYGRTVDHVAELTVVLSSGEIATFAAPSAPAAVALRQEADTGVSAHHTASEIELGLGDIRDRHFEEIQRRFPKIMRSNGGYGLDRLGPPGTAADAIKILCGSEGTLGVIVAAKLRLVALPAQTGLAILHFRSVDDALAATPGVLRHGPSAVELIDRLIIDAGRQNAGLRDRVDFLMDEPQAVLAVEFFGDSPKHVSDRLYALACDAELASVAFATQLVTEPSRQAAVWSLRTSGLGLLMSKPGDEQPYSFVEDTAVDPSRLAEYMRRFAAILDGERVHAGYYAHASVGCIHVKPVLNLRRSEGVEQLRRIAEAVSDLAIEFGGTMTGEHGDGIVRSCWLEKMYGPTMMSAFREVKALFDPAGIMNPHKIVEPWPMTGYLRQGQGLVTAAPPTMLDFSSHGGLAGLAGMCSGVGQCRQRLVGVMCPSYVATRDETHTTRARANALRVALSNRGLLVGLDDPALAEVMDLCIGCKACKNECPTGVDMAAMKAEYLSHRNLTCGATARSRFLADLPSRLRSAQRFSRLANLVAGSAWARRRLERRLGLDARIRPPRLAYQTFRHWYARRRRISPPDASQKKVIYFVDTWTNYFSPQVGMAAVSLLERAGCNVICPELACCGRPAISQGLLLEAKDQAEQNIRRLAPAAARGIPILVSEPSCASALLDEYPRLVRTPLAQLVASRTTMVETFLRQELERGTGITLRGFDSTAADVLYHGHCHQKALLGTSDAMALLRHFLGDSAQEINSGCCGMAGAFGHEKEHYDVARAMGENRLFPAIRENPGATIAVSGFSCRQQIEHHTSARPLHLLEVLAGSLA